VSTIDWPIDLSQTYVNVAGDSIVVTDDHQTSGQHTADLDVPTARLLAHAHRQVADALDRAATQVLAARMNHTFAVLERLLVPNPDLEAVKAAAANVRALIQETETGEPAPPAAPPVAAPPLAIT
jgi:hypothetical protein